VPSQNTAVVPIFFQSLFLTVAIAHAANAAPQASSPPQQTGQLEAVQSDLSRLANSVAEVRRDELNYQIERDLLKETYSSNLQTINMVIAFVFGFATVIISLLGYFGLKSIREIRGDFVRELSEFRSSRSDLEQRLGDLMHRATEASERLTVLSQQNSKQEERLKYLELTEKIGALTAQKRDTCER
jgi:hypothetical protein